MSVEVKVLITHTNLMLTQINEVHKLLMVRPSSETTKSDLNSKVRHN
mgnify:CR=1 FL=1